MGTDYLASIKYFSFGKPRKQHLFNPWSVNKKMQIWKSVRKISASPYGCHILNAVLMRCHATGKELQFVSLRAQWGYS